MADELLADQLGTTDLTVSTIANIGPGIDFYFGFALIAVSAGTGAPLTIVAAAIAVGLLGITATDLDTALEATIEAARTD
jgi:amino acid transporter